MSRGLGLLIVIAAIVLLPYSWPRALWRWWRIRTSRTRVVTRPSPMWSGDPRTLT